MAAAAPRPGRWRSLAADPLALVVAGAIVAAIGFAAVRWWPGRAAVVRVLREERPPDLSRFDVPLREAARESGVDPDLLRGLVAAESSGDPRARSRAGAVGLLQLMPETAAEQARKLGMDARGLDLEDPATNLRLGAAYFARLLALFDGEVVFAVAAYNAGPEPVRRWRLRAADASADEVVRREGYPESRGHVERALRFRDAYRRG